MRIPAPLPYIAFTGLLGCLASPGRTQSCSSEAVLSNPGIRRVTTTAGINFHFTPQTFCFTQTPVNTAGRQISHSPPPYLPAWRAESLPFFCRIEHQWGKKLSLPVKFRLGSVEYVDWLEGKQ